MKKILSIILVLALVVLCFVSCDDNSSSASGSFLTGIEITTKPSKLEYTVGESLNTSGMVVTAQFSNNKTKIVTGYSVDTGVFSTAGTITVNVSYTVGEITKSAGFNVNVKNPQFTVTFVKNDTKAGNPSFETKTVTYNSNYGELPTVAMDNHSFVGWSDAPNGGNLITADSKVTKTSNHFLYAQWVEGGKYKVRFVCNDSTSGTVPSDKEGYIGQEITLPGNIGNLTKTNYTFDGWQTCDQDYPAGSSFISNEEPFIILYAKWKGDTYSITYDYNGGEAPLIANPATYSCGEGVAAFNSPNRFNYSFVGWYCVEAQKIITSITSEDYGNKKLLAQWEFRKGSASIIGGEQRRWVQLWKYGPKWAEFNVGSTITDYSAVTSTEISEAYSKANVGGLYQFGGTMNRETRQEAGTTYIGEANKDIKGTGFSGGPEGSLGDTAFILWGNKWRMPTLVEFNQLKNSCIWEWCDGQPGEGHKQYVDGCTLAGYKISGKNEYACNSIFLPASGRFYSNAVQNQGSSGFYWSSNTNDTANNAYMLTILSGSSGTEGSFCYYGNSVRAVLNED